MDKISSTICVRVIKTTITRAEYAARVGENVKKSRDMDKRGRIILKWKAV